MPASTILKVFARTLFLIEAAGQQHTCIANDEASGLHKNFQTKILKARHHFRAVLLDSQWAFSSSDCRVHQSTVPDSSDSL
jgi:hypothetical protein